MFDERRMMIMNRRFIIYYIKDVEFVDFKLRNDSFQKSC